VHFIDKDKDFVKLLQDKELGLTFFAPNNEAIEKVLPHHIALRGGGDKDDRRKHYLEDTLRYHVLPQVIEYNRLGQNSTLATELHADDGTFGGHRRRVKVESSLLPPWKVTLNNYAVVTESDIRAVNGVIHKVDTPLFQPLDIQDALYLFPGEFSTTTTALLKVNLQNEYEFNSDYSSKEHRHNDRHGQGTGATTFFAPTNAAWNELPRDLVFFLFSPVGERTLRKLLAFHTIPSGIVFSEWGRHVKEDSSFEAVNDEDDLSFEWDHHFPSLTSQKLPVHSKKYKTILPGSNQYKIEFQAHGLYARVWDNVAQNGAVHVLDDVISPRSKEGTDKVQNAKDWLEWKDWLFEWSKNTDDEAN